MFELGLGRCKRFVSVEAEGKVGIISREGGRPEEGTSASI